MTGNRLLIILGALAIVLVGAGVLAFALLFPAAGRFPSLPPLTPTPSTVPTARADQVRAVEGVIQALGNQSLLITLPGGRTVTVAVSAHTTYTNGNSAASFGSLRVGQTIIARGRVNSQAALLALSILIAPPAANP